MCLFNLDLENIYEKYLNVFFDDEDDEEEEMEKEEEEEEEEIEVRREFFVYDNLFKKFEISIY